MTYCDILAHNLRGIKLLVFFSGKNELTTSGKVVQNDVSECDSLSFELISRRYIRSVIENIMTVNVAQMAGVMRKRSFGNFRFFP